MATKDKFSADRIARLKHRYEETDQTVAAIARDEGLSERQLHALKRNEGWRARSAIRPAGKKASDRKSTAKKSAAKKSTDKKSAAKQPSARQSTAGRPTAEAGRAPASPKPRTVSKPPPGVVDTPTLIARIRAQLEGALETAQERGPEADPDATARLMASLTRTLQSLRALEKDTTQDGRRQDDRRDDGADAPPLDLAELRRELARRIDRLREERGDT
ncbi:MAG: hypothetical protein U1E30_15105 [Rhodoblastus sp.]